MTFTDKLTSITTIKKLLSKHNLRPSRALGQNFLISAQVLRKIVEAADLKPDDTVVEIGAGLGALTVELAKRVKKVIAFEIDKKLLPILKDNLQDFNNVEIVDKDFLTASLPEGNYKVVANLPYQITSAAIEKILEAEPRPELIILLVQKEVAERICAKSGEMSLLSVAVQYYGQPEIIAMAPRNNFWPAPKVDSAILKVTMRSMVISSASSSIISSETRNPPQSSSSLAGDLSLHSVPFEMTKKTPRDDQKEKSQDERFFKLVKAGFSHRRQMLKNNLRAIMPEEKLLALFKQLNLNPKVRAQELTIDQWKTLAKVWYDY